MNLKTKKSKSPVILIFGPTAVGKTAFIDSLSSLKYEIVNVDSMQVYKYMDIGTAKPDAKSLSNIKYHLIDICEPSEQFNAGDFVRLADESCSDILSRGKIPILCGGTAFYFRNFMFGLPEAPPTDREVSKEIEAEILSGKREELYEFLKRVDPVSANRININDTYRLSRAIEVYRTSGKALSSFDVSMVLRDKYDMSIFQLSLDREKLYKRIDKRVDLMFNLGLEDEVDKLKAMGFVKDNPGMQGIGYREFFLYDNISEIRDKIKLNSRRYAKRQLTFFNSFNNSKKVFVDNPKDMENFFNLF